MSNKLAAHFLLNLLGKASIPGKPLQQIQMLLELGGKVSKEQNKLTIYSFTPLWDEGLGLKSAVLHALT